MARDTEEILAAVRHLVDPEIGINVVDLGLVYEVRRQDDQISVVMTMTTAACPLGEALTEQVKAAIRQHVHGVTSISVDLVWEPAWKPSMMSPSAREQLGWK